MERKVIGSGIISSAVTAIFMVVPMMFPQIEPSTGYIVIAVLVVVAVFGACLALWPAKEKGKEVMTGDTYNNSGTNYGHMGPVNNYGKQPSEMTEQVMSEWYKKTDGWARFGVAVHGFNPKSAAHAKKLLDYLRERGRPAVAAPGTGQLVGADIRHVFVGPYFDPENPVYSTGKCLYIDADR
ncbi:hypothetical protein [Ensifer canadensis]